MFFSRLIRWLAGLPAPYALGLLWWGEVTVLFFTMAGGHTLSGFVYEELAIRWENWLFPIALVTYLLMFFVIHREFGKISQLMEAVIHIHRMGGLERIERLRQEEMRQRKPEKLKENEEAGEEIFDPLAPPERIRASAEAFKIRYFVVLPVAFLLYLMSFTSTIYKIFTRQVLKWDPSSLAIPALAAVAVACLCFWLLMPHLPGYVSVRILLGHKSREGD